MSSDFDIVRKRRKAWARWIAEVAQKVNPHLDVTTRLSPRQRDALAAYCIRRGGIPRSQAVAELIEAGTADVDVGAELRFFLRTGEGRPPLPGGDYWEIPAPGVDALTGSGFVAAPTPAPLPAPRVPPPLPFRPARES